MKRALFILGVGLGFVLGARAGRGRYEQIKRTSARVFRSEPVQQTVATAQYVLDEATPVISQQARSFAEQAGEASKRVADRIGVGAQQVGETVGESASEFLERFTSRADDLSARVTHSADDLRARSEEIKRLSEEQLERVSKLVGDEVERRREAQVEGFVRAGDLRDQALAEIVTDDDEMLEPGASRES